MRYQPTIRRGVWTLLLLALLAGSGCVSLCPTVHPLDAELVRSTQNLPCGARKHVYIFMIDGLDPSDLADLEGLHECLANAGFYKVWVGQCYHLPLIAKKMRQIHCEDPEGRFVLLGSGSGANEVRLLAESVQKDQLVIDLVVYTGGYLLRKDAKFWPDNVARVLNVLPEYSLVDGCDLPGAENCCVPTFGHHNTSTHPETVEMLLQELTLVACKVPIVIPAEPSAPFLAEPTPHPIEQPGPMARRDEWDFLKPADAWRGRDDWDFLQPDLKEEILPAPRRLPTPVEARTTSRP